MAEVHRLTAAGPILEPDAALVAKLRDLSAAAERGEIKGMGFFWIDGGNGLTTGWEAGCAPSQLMVAGAAVLQHRIVEGHLK